MRASYLLTFIIALTLVVSVYSAAQAATITDYEVIFLPFRAKNSQVRFAIRSFKRDGRPAYLILDPYAFVTTVAEGHLDIKNQPEPKDWEATPFIKALYRYTAPSDMIANQGLTSAEGEVKGVFVTVDMCPSTRPFDKLFFEKTAALGSARKPVPVAVMISGVWIKKHGEEFRWLADAQKAGRLDITWVNHSYSHPYISTAALDKNFLLAPGVNFDDEVLFTERLLLESGLTPAPFFRYPGLISNAALQKRLRSFTLIPVGANAWLAKGEAAASGSVILVHGNGNEPVGIKAALSFYEVNKADIKNGNLRLMGIREAFEVVR